MRLVPLPSSKISEEMTRCLRGFPQNAFFRQRRSFFGKTLLIIDHPGFSMFHKSDPAPDYLQEFSKDELPSQVEVHDAKFPNSKESSCFKKLFVKYCLWFAILQFKGLVEDGFSRK